MLDFPQLRRKCEEWLINGQSLRVAQALSDLNVAQIPRPERWPLARLARRANLIKLGLRILSPIVNDDRYAYKDDVSEPEWAEYGILLFLVGSLKEGLAILEKLSVPDALLFRAFCLFSEWKYHEARPLLEQYVNHEGLNDYQRAVGRVNLASVLITVESDQDIGILNGLALEFRKAGYKRLLANINEMLAQAALRRGAYSDAENFLNEAVAIFAEDETIDRLFVEKWQAVLALVKGGNPHPLEQFKAKALAARHWESIRDADYHLLKKLNEEWRFKHLYFGTPHESYKQRLADLGLFQVRPKEAYEFGSGRSLLDLASCEIDGRIWTKPGKAVHRLLALLVSDFYRPFQIGSVFSHLFPDEKFNIFSSPSRVHQLIFRTREALSGLPLDVTETDGTYHFQLREGLRVRVQNSDRLISSEDIRLIRLGEVFGGNLFSARDACAALALPLTTTNRTLRHALANGQLVQHGAGSKTRYRMALSDSTRKSA